MKKLPNLSSEAVSRFWDDCRGQDMIEYALLTGLVATAVAAFVPMQAVPAASRIFSKVTSVLAKQT